MRRLLLLWLLAGLALAACGGTAAPATETPLDVTLVAADIAYDRPVIEVAAGRPLRLTLDNEGVLLHDFSIREIALDGEAHVEEAESHDEATAAHEEEMAHAEEPAVHVAAAAGAHGVVEFTAADPGEYEYYCTVPGHKEAGMVGTLRVTTP